MKTDNSLSEIVILSKTMNALTVIESELASSDSPELIAPLAAVRKAQTVVSDKIQSILDELEGR